MEIDKRMMEYKTLLLLVFMTGFLGYCQGVDSSLNQNKLPDNETSGNLETKIVLVSNACNSPTTDLDLLELSLNTGIELVSLKQSNARQPVWSPNGKMLGFLLHQDNNIILRIIDAETQKVLNELQGDILQISWATDSKSMFYLDDQEQLYQYDIETNQSKYLTEGVSSFSVSFNGRWLGLSKREDREDQFDFGYFKFRILDISNERLFGMFDEDIELVGTSFSVWSPITDEVAVLFGNTSSQISTINIYEFQTDKVTLKNSMTVRDIVGSTVERVDLGGFSNINWAPNGQALLAGYSREDGNREIFLVDKALSNYQPLPFGQNIGRFSWSSNYEWAVYTTIFQENNNCLSPFNGEVWLANMETLETQLLFTNTFSIERPVWMP